LRLSSGRVAGYTDYARAVPAMTTLAGLAVKGRRARPGSPWELPPRWRERMSQVALPTPINFVTDADVGGGAPGAVVLNQRGEALGMIIDINAKAALNPLLYRGESDRAVGVHAAGIVEALRKVYQADGLADEIDSAPPAVR
jgi:hypothetical protein